MKKTFILINLVLIFFIVDFSISAFYKQVTAKFEINEESNFTDTRQIKRETKTFKNPSDYKNVAKRDLFETEKIAPPEKKPPSKPVAEPAKEIQLTALKLELKGTITGTGSDPFAVIKKKGDKNEMLYETGDSVDRAVIKAILRERVILLVDGKEETLLMEKIKPPQDSKTASSSVSQGAETISAQMDKQGFTQKVSLTWNDVTTLTKDMENLRKQVRVRPHFYKGRMDGFRVTGIRKASVFYDKLGLRNGDIVTAVNEKQIRSIDDVLTFYNGFKELEGNIATEVDIKRKGLPGKIRYSIE